MHKSIREGIQKKSFFLGNSPKQRTEESSVFTNNINEIMHLNIKVYKDLYQCKVCDNAQRLLLHNGGSVSAIKEQE